MKYPSRQYALPSQPVARFWKFLKPFNPDNYNFHYSACIEIKRNMEMTSLKPRENSLFEDVFKVFTPSFHTSFHFPVLLLVFRRDRAISQSLLMQCLDSQFIVYGNFTHHS